MSRILYKTSTYDPETQHPIYILDSFFLPSSLSINPLIKTDDEILASLLGQIDTKFSLCIFSSSFNQGSGNDKLVSIRFVKLLRWVIELCHGLVAKIFILHHDWVTKSLLDIFNLVNFKCRLVHCDSLTSLSKHMDLTQLNISLPTYIYDLKFNEKIIVPIHLKPVFEKPITVTNTNTVQVFKRLYNKLLDYLAIGDYHDLPYLLNLDLPVMIQDKINILLNCLKRNQILNLSDWSFVEIYKVLLELVVSVNKIDQPLFDISMVLDKKSIDEILNHVYVDTVTYNNKFIIIKLLQLFKLILLKFENKREKLLLILSISKKMFNNSYDIELNHSEVFNDFFKFIESVLIGDCDLIDLVKFGKISINEWKLFDKCDNDTVHSSIINSENEMDKSATDDNFTLDTLNMVSELRISGNDIAKGKILPDTSRTLHTDETTDILKDLSDSDIIEDSKKLPDTPIDTQNEDLAKDLGTSDPVDKPSDSITADTNTDTTFLPDSSAKPSGSVSENTDAPPASETNTQSDSTSANTQNTDRNNQPDSVTEVSNPSDHISETIADSANTESHKPAKISSDITDKSMTDYEIQIDKEHMARLKPRYERLVKLTKPTIAEKEEIAKIEKEIKLKPWVKGKNVGKLTLFYEKEMIL